MQWLRLFAVLYASAVLFGMNVGIQGIFTAVAKRGVFSDQCTIDVPTPMNSSTDPAHYNATTLAPSLHLHASLPCLGQEQKIAAVVTVMLSVTNLVSLPNGFLIDALGGELVSIAAVSVWVVATACAGIAPSSGIVWATSVCLTGWANSAAFMSFSVVHLRLATDGDKGKFSLWSTIGMACRAVGALVSIPMSMFLEIDSFEFWSLYFLWAIVIGLPIVVILIFLWWRPPATAANASPPGSPTSPSLQDVEKVTQRFSKVRLAAADLKAVLPTAPFIAVTARLTLLVTFGSIFIANLGALARYHGADKEELATLRRHFTFFLGALGATNPIPGLIIKKLQTHRGIAVVSVLSILFTISFTTSCLSAKGHLRWPLYLSFTFFSLWRYWGLGVCSLYVPTVFPDRQAGFGLIFGAMSFVAGFVSLALGSYITYLVQHHTDAIPIVFGVFAICIVITDVASIVTMLMARREQMRAALEAVNATLTETASDAIQDETTPLVRKS